MTPQGSGWASKGVFSPTPAFHSAYTMFPAQIPRPRHDYNDFVASLHGAPLFAPDRPKVAEDTQARALVSPPFGTGTREESTFPNRRFT